MKITGKVENGPSFFEMPPNFVCSLRLIWRGLKGLIGMGLYNPAGNGRGIYLDMADATIYAGEQCCDLDRSGTVYYQSENGLAVYPRGAVKWAVEHADWKEYFIERS